MKKLKLISKRKIDLLIIDEESSNAIKHCVPDNMSYSILPVRNVIPFLISIKFFIKLFVKITNGVFTVILDVITANSPNLGQWNSKSFNLNQLISLNSTMQIIIETVDWDFLGSHLVECGFDKFEILTQSSSSITDLSTVTKKIVKIVDILGRTSNFEPNSLIFYIYDDGSVDKRFILK